MFTPSLPTGGIGGFRFLERTMDAQKEAFNASPEIAREVEYFRENIADVKTPEDLLGDRRLLNVALGAFGMEGEAYKTAFLQRALEEGSGEDAFVTRISDQRYTDFVEAFAFDIPGGPFTDRVFFQNDIVEKFQEQRFEQAIGEQSQSMRLAMNYERRIADVAGQFESENAFWFTVMSDPPLRSVLENTLGMPADLKKADVDRQLTEFKSRAQSVFGTSDPAELAKPENIDKAVTRYLAIDQAINGGQLQSTTPSAALSILQGSVSGGVGGDAIMNILLSAAQANR